MIDRIAPWDNVVTGGAVGEGAAARPSSGSSLHALAVAWAGLAVKSEQPFGASSLAEPSATSTGPVVDAVASTAPVSEDRGPRNLESEGANDEAVTREGRGSRVHDEAIAQEGRGSRVHDEFEPSTSRDGAASRGSPRSQASAQVEQPRRRGTNPRRRGTNPAASPQQQAETPTRLEQQKPLRGKWVRGKWVELGG
jgi:hypothetical protein